MTDIWAGMLAELHRGNQRPLEPVDDREVWRRAKVGDRVRVLTGWKNIGGGVAGVFEVNEVDEIPGSGQNIRLGAIWALNDSVVEIVS